MKVLVILLVSCIVFGLAIPAHAEEQNQFHKGSVEWLSRCFMVGSNVTLRVTDPDMNHNSELVEEINVTMWSDNDNREVMYALTETGKDTGVFDANVFFTTTDSSPGKRLRIVDGSTVSAKYVDYTSPESYMAIDVINSVTTGLSVLERNTDGDISQITYDPCALELLMQNPDRFEQMDVFYPPPLKQSSSGLFVDEVRCKESFSLLQKYDGSPACVTESTKTKLIERGWTTKDSFHDTIPIKSDNISLENNFPNIKERDIILQIGKIQDNNGALSVNVLENMTVQEHTDNIMFQKVGYSAMRTISKNNDYFSITSGNDTVNFKTLQEPTLQTIFTGKDKHQTTIYFPIQIQLEQDLKENESVLFNYSLPYVTPVHDKTYSLSITSLQPLTLKIPTNAVMLDSKTRIDSVFWLYEKDKGNTLSHEAEEYSLYYGTTNPPIMIKDIVVYDVKFKIDE